MSKLIGKCLNLFLKLFPASISGFPLLKLARSWKLAKSFPSKKIYPSDFQVFDIPSTVVEPAPAGWDRRYPVNEGRVWLFEDAFATHCASHLTKKAQLLWDLSENFDLPSPCEHVQFHFRFKNLFKAVYRADATVGSIVVDSAKNPYHWLYDALARLHLIERSGHNIDMLYAPLSTEYQRRTLELLGWPEKRIIDSSKYAFIRAKSLVLPSFTLFNGQKEDLAVPTWALRWLREKFALAEVKPFRKIFISRSDASYRKLLNEEALWHELNYRGFERIVLSEKSFEEQRQIFAESEVIVSPHGAGLAGLIFCAQNTKIVEMFYPYFTPACYWQLADKLALQYSYCLGEPLDSTPSRWPFEDIYVELEKLKKVLEKLDI